MYAGSDRDDSKSPLYWAGLLRLWSQGVIHPTWSDPALDALSELFSLLLKKNLGLGVLRR